MHKHAEFLDIMSCKETACMSALLIFQKWVVANHNGSWLLMIMSLPADLSFEVFDAMFDKFTSLQLKI